MKRMETALRLAGCSFGVGGVPFWGKLRASMEQMETAHRLAARSLGVGGVPFRSKPQALTEHWRRPRRVLNVPKHASAHPVLSLLFTAIADLAMFIRE